MSHFLRIQVKISMAGYLLLIFFYFTILHLIFSFLIITPLFRATLVIAVTFGAFYLLDSPSLYVCFINICLYTTPFIFEKNCFENCQLLLQSF
jgi:hypothetical protein